MIEVLFGEGEVGAMKAAKNKMVIGKTDGPTSVWIAGTKKPLKREHCGWIEGTSDEVICLGFMLDIGDILEETGSVYRKELIHSMLAQEQWGADDGMDEGLLEAGDIYYREMDRLKKYLEDGESIRLWYSDAPYSVCGFYHLCDILQNYENEVYVVKLPQYKVRENSIVSCSNWGEVSAEEFAGFLDAQKELSAQEIRMYAMRWKEEQKDNSPLRVMVNGRLTGAPEDFYDFLIWKNLTEKPIKEARLIGNILGRNQIGVGDWWYAKRIDYYIAQGKIKVVEDSERNYARIICLA